MFQVTLPDSVKYIIKKLTDAGYSAYAVGGCVRDSILGNQPKDYDVTTAALPEQTMEVFRGHRLIETGLKHGTVTILLDGEPIEVTTFRVDEGYSDNRHPDAVRFTRNFREDAARRDFTMNAIGYNDTDGLMDPFGGQEDIAAGVIRAVGDAETRFREDALRILRALRFAAVLGFTIEEKTSKAIFSCKNLLANISAERIATELLKLLCGKAARRIIMEYAEVISAVIPEILPMIGFEQKNPHHIYTVLEHSAAAVEAIPAEPALRLAALLHDIGKPKCFFTDEQSIGHFYGHPAVSAELTEKILTRLKLDTATKERVITLVKHHDIMIENTEKSVKRNLNRLSPEVFFQLLELKRADCRAQHPDYSYRLPYYDELQALAERILAEGQCFSLRDLAVNGRDMIALGYNGKEIGDALDELLEKVIGGELPNDRDILLKSIEKTQ